MRRTDTENSNSRTQRLVTRGGLLLGAVVVLGGLAGLVERARANSDGAFGAVGLTPAEARSTLDSLESLSGALAVSDLELTRARAIIEYSAIYQIPSDLSAAIYDIALSEGINPAIGFRLVQIESSFKAKARSSVGAIGYTQLMPATARFYMPEITEKMLYDRDINLRIGFRFLRQLMARFDGNLHYALLAYNRGPVTVREILSEGGNPANGYAQKVMGK
jgi:soluble lytic murein transglycosylase-like protein